MAINRSPNHEERDKPRGLPSVAQARAERRAAKGMKWLPPRFWVWAIVFIGAGLIVWWKIDEGKINKMRGELLARQRAVVEKLGPKWLPLRDRIEKWTQECAVNAFVDEPNEKLAEEWDFRKMPGIYLRVAVPNAKSVKSVREAANKSLKDGFTACLFQVNNPSPLAGPECDTTEDCPPKNICNEFNHCAEPHQPFNARLAYKALYMLSDEWIADTQAITNALIMRGALATFEANNKYDLPIATDMLARSKYFLAVVDEPLPGDDGLELPDVTDAGAEDDRSIPTAAHPARICLWRLEDNKKMIAIRRDADGELRGATTASINPKTLIARKRQANSCSLALALREAMGAAAGAAVEGDDDDDGMPVPAPSTSTSAAPSTSTAPSPSTAPAPSASASAPK